MVKQSKRLTSAAAIERIQHIFRCPICKAQMQMITSQRLCCSNEHSFDIARQGYLNLLSRAHNTNYDKNIFVCRRAIGRSGFFDPLHAAISSVVIDRLPTHEPASLLDAGCGEGSHFVNIQEEMMRHNIALPCSVGIDISKEGIGFAAAEYSNATWCVADIANCPFADRQFEIVLNILSPANYSEFRRLIADDGMVIKVIPGREYLKELREVLYEGSNKQAYSNARTLDHFNAHFEIADVESLRYQVDLREPLIEPLLGMTPLSWGTSRERLDKVRAMHVPRVTVDFKILIGKNPLSRQNR
ncbi:putative RNA methyltransferase [Paenibacillus glycinis]|uniref:Methyltransferase domain-containing protein n=1 Tax=Paenibacillus glycinis TaxID=2697035 RepID=A0ABW9XYU3_9BACL|nr:methyltransferase domain-containing protein [Paenibacillus glycinis]NBD27401.1 methyltransferase domain-containing protein [Paenibacillus glycinis]